MADRFAPTITTRSASVARRMSLGARVKVCGSAPLGTVLTTSARSPATCPTMSAMIVVEATMERGPSVAAASVAGAADVGAAASSLSSPPQAVAISATPASSPARASPSPFRCHSPMSVLPRG